MKLQSLEKFKNEQLEAAFMNKINGGMESTEGGQNCFSGGDTGAGCYDYTSDYSYSYGGNTVIEAHGKTEVDLDCSPVAGSPPQDERIFTFTP